MLILQSIDPRLDSLVDQRLFCRVILPAESTEAQVWNFLKIKHHRGLKPLFIARNRLELDCGFQNPEFTKLQNIQNRLVENSGNETFSVNGFCVPCGTTRPFLVDMASGGQRTETGWIPNWRERLACPGCDMNNRQRLIAALVKRELDRRGQLDVYFMEYVTPVYEWTKRTHPGHQVVGSEYLGYEYKSGDVVNGIRHEDVMDLSFENESQDLIVSNDVFEHVPAPEKAFAECARVLRPGGVMLATIPFYNTYDVSLVRARLTEDGLEHLLPPMFHGNPISENGSLVFTDFGWDIIQSFLLAGFSDARIESYASTVYGHMGTGQLVFRLVKGRS